MINLLKKWAPQTILFWAPHETSVFKKLSSDTMSFMKDYLWVDMLEEVKNANIVKGAYTFKLKDVARAMFANGTIRTIWDENDLVQSGEVAAKEAANMYITGDKRMWDHLEKYNKIGVITTMEIWQYLASKTPAIVIR